MLEASSAPEASLGSGRFLAPTAGLMALHWRCGADGCTEYPWVGEGCRELLGLEPAALMADPALFWQRVHPDDRAPLKLAEARARLQGGMLHHRCRLLDGRGDARPVLIVAVPIPPDGVLWQALVQDGSEQQRRLEECDELRRALAEQEQQVAGKARLLAEAHAAIVRLSTTDALTGLPNRLHFQHSLLRAVGQAQRHGQPLTLVRCDLRGLRRLNGRSGLLAGDRALRRFADHLAAAIGPDHMAARLGGVEFAALLPDTEPAAAEPLLHELAAAWQLCPVLGPAGLHGISAAVACRAEDSPDTLLARAEEALLR